MIDYLISTFLGICAGFVLGFCLKDKFGTRLRIRFDDVEIEAYSMDEVEDIIEKLKYWRGR